MRQTSYHDMMPLGKRGWANDDFLCFPCPAIDEADTVEWRGDKTRAGSGKARDKKEKRGENEGNECPERGELRSEEKVFNLSCPTM